MKTNQMNSNDISIQKLKRALASSGAPLFSGALNLNIIGVRSADSASNTFNDYICVLYQDQNLYWRLRIYEATTDPALFYKKNPINVNGTAILKPGHYRSCWKLGKHRGKYEALVQRGTMTVQRMLEPNDPYFKNTDFHGLFGINLHRAARWSVAQFLNRWSAGCQVIRRVHDYREFMRLVHASAAIYGTSFSYTLITEEDLCKM